MRGGKTFTVLTRKTEEIITNRSKPVQPFLTTTCYDHQEMMLYLQGCTWWPDFAHVTCVPRSTHNCYLVEVSTLKSWKAAALLLYTDCQDEDQPERSPVDPYLTHHFPPCSASRWPALWIGGLKAHAKSIQSCLPTISQSNPMRLQLISATPSERLPSIFRWYKPSLQSLIWEKPRNTCS